MTCACLRFLTPLMLAFFAPFLALPLSAATPQEYDRALAQVQQAMRTQAEAIDAQEVSSGASPSLLSQQVLGPIHAVTVPGQVPVPVDPSLLISAIGTAEAIRDPDAKVAALEALSGQIALLRNSLVTPGKKPDPAATLRSARAVLAQPEFASAPLPPPSLAERIADWLDRLFTRRPSPNMPRFNGPSINPNIIQGILIAIAAAAFIFLVTVIVRAIGRRDARIKPLVLDEEEAVLVEARDKDSLLALAEEQAKSGDFRRAFRLIYLAALVALDTGGVLRFDRSKTNWEYLRALRAAGRSDVYAAMTPLTREFDQVWYGFAPSDSSQYARAKAQYQALLAAAPEQTGTQAENAAKTVSP